MDGSFLSRESVVAASREFVCIRLATYEDRGETRFLSRIFSGRDGKLQNTVFAVMAPDGKQLLTRAGRGPHFAFRDAADMASFMSKTVANFRQQNDAFEQPLPVVAKVDVALNVAACDALPVIVRVTDNTTEKTAFDRALAVAAWNEEFAGQFVYAVAKSAELSEISGVEIEDGILIVEPDEFGTSAATIVQLSHTTDQDDIEAAMKQVLDTRVLPTKDPREHILAGIQLGIDWETAVPVTDQQSLDAKARFRGNK